MKWGLIALCFLALPAACTAEQSVDFNRDIRPILSNRCFHCHGPNEADRQANLRLDMAEGPEGAYRTLDDVQAIRPGSLDASQVWHRITSEDDDVMPPPDSHKKPLTQSEKDLFRQWIMDGAKYADFWAFIAPRKPDLPEVEDQRWCQQPIDRFVWRKLEAEGLTPNPSAQRRTLIRRVSLDLTGLPPTREEIRRFLADSSSAAYERLVDRLLARPQYGEHMAKYWLDLVRFADTNGIHHDHYREMTPYRDWVIRAFNRNLPYDEFVKYQLAGDCYPEPTRDQLIASGFHRLHLIIDVGTALPEESHVRNVVDRVTAVGTAFLGLTMQCAVCHDHKYDPITMKDFYQLSAFLNNLDGEPETGSRSGTDFQRGLQPPYISLATERQQAQLEDLDRQISQARLAVEELEELKAREELVEAEEGKDVAELEEGEELEELKEETELAGVEHREAREGAAGHEVRERDLDADLKEANETLAQIQGQKQALEIVIPAAMVMKERVDMRPAHMLIRGQYDKPGERVERDTPGFLPPLKKTAGPRTRMDLADWFMSPAHPLTARVAVNRFWQQLFGVGIVKTAEDFGAQGEWPSHPELLDYLAVSFMESGWDVKALMKQIVMCETYRQSSEASPVRFAADPQNRLLSRGSRFRLDSEVIRDQVLFTSGLLNCEMFGKSVKPPQPAGLWEAVTMPSSYPRTYESDTGVKIYRRSVYTFWKRGMPPPQMTILNAPSREFCLARRERTNTPLQALLLMNEQEYVKAARHLAHQTIAQGELNPADRVAAIYETITSQLPAADETRALLKLVEDLERIYHANPGLADQLCDGVQLPEETSATELAAWTLLVSTIYNLDITRTRE